jgi:predicted MPP superfamily phosphohydrolase
VTRASRAAATTLGGVAAVGAAAFAWGVFVERNRFTVRHEVVPVLEPGSRSLTILHISDLHMAPWQTAKQDFVRSLARFEPDFVIDTGDNLGHVDGNIGVERALAPFTGIPGVFVHGSNDYHGPLFKNPLRYFVTAEDSRPGRVTNLDTAGMERFFTEQLGWLDLNNTARAIEIRGTRIELFGTNDAHRNWDRLDLLPGAIEAVRENVGWSVSTRDQVLSIGVTHAPYRRVLDDFVNQGALLVLAGHTHGGQVRIPGLPALVTNCDIPREQAQGLSTWHSGHKQAYLNVSAGIGTSIYAPFRFACPPEAVLLTLIERSAEDEVGYGDD